MKLILDIDTPDGKQRRVWMGVGELMRVGRSSQADVCLERDGALADIHFEIQGHRDGWELRTMPGNSVGMHGVTHHRLRLSHGDLVIAGESEFRISIEGYARETAKATEKPATAQVQQPLSYTVAQLTSGVVQFSIIQGDQTLGQILELIRADAQLLLALNEQQFGKAIAGVKKQTENLFEMAPEEIRETDSLFIGEVDLSDGATLDQVAAAAKADSALFCVTAQTVPELLQSHVALWGWFARPSILQFQMSKGSKDLAKKLLTSMQCVISLTTDGCDILVLTTKEHEEKLRQLLDA